MNPKPSAPDANAPEPLRDYRLKKLLVRRQSLSTAAIEHLCHDLPGADLLWQAVHQTEEQLRHEYPEVWTQSNTEWVAADAARLHSPDRPAPDACWLCMQRYVPGAELRSAS
jgi:hypothetical protein